MSILILHIGFSNRIFSDIPHYCVQYNYAECTLNRLAGLESDLEQHAKDVEQKVGKVCVCVCVRVCVCVCVCLFIRERKRT